MKLRQLMLPAFIIIGVVMYLMWIHFSSATSLPMNRSNFDSVKKSNREYSKWPPYSSLPKHTSSWYYSNCYTSFQTSTMGLGHLYDLLKQWRQATQVDCIELFRAFDAIYSVSQRTSMGIVIPDSFMPKFLHFLNNNKTLLKEAQHQTITFVFNEFTHEETIFNPLREKRPISQPKRPDKDYIEEITMESSKSCDFCSYKEFTALDPFGRLESKYSYTASNAFKYDAWHCLVALKTHDPLHWNHEHFLDFFNLAIQWVNKVHSVESKYIYPVISWDLLPHAGASQIHPHMHVSMTDDRYYGVVESWKISAEKYFRQTGGRNYFSDITHIHDALGLAVHYGTATVFANINPKKDNELVVIGKQPNKDFFSLLYIVMRTFMDDMEMYCLSSITALPKLGMSTQYGDIPAYTRIVTRGSASSVRADVSSLELFLASNVNIDPYKVIKHIQKSVSLFKVRN